MNFDGKTIIVTGAGGGIGEVYARGCARQGMNVVVAELSQEKGASVADSINEEGGKAIEEKEKRGAAASNAHPPRVSRVAS